MATYTIAQLDEGDERNLTCLEAEVQFTCQGAYGEDGVAFDYDQVEAIFYEAGQGQLFFQVEGEVFSIRCSVDEDAQVTAAEYFINRAREAWGLEPIELT